jgi:hypothetical protein
MSSSGSSMNFGQIVLPAKRSNPAADLAPFGRWTLRDEAAQRDNRGRLRFIFRDTEIRRSASADFLDANSAIESNPKLTRFVSASQAVTRYNFIRSSPETHHEFQYRMRGRG